MRWHRCLGGVPCALPEGRGRVTGTSAGEAQTPPQAACGPAASAAGNAPDANP